RLGLARALSSLHRGKEAIPLVESLVKAQPRDAAAALGLAEAELEAGLPAEAGRALSAVEKLAPAARVKYLKGRIEEGRGGPGADLRAAALYKEAVAADAGSVDAGLALVRVLGRSGQAEAARAAMAGVEKRAAGDPLLRDRVGR